jgi:uncharacterized OB-fold protein
MSLPFWRTRDRYYRILGNKCEKCAHEYFPPVNVCPNCHSTKFVDKEMPKDGTLLSYSLQKESMAGFEEQEPMIFGLVKLENGVRIIAQLVDIPYESMKEGMKLVAVFRRIKAEGESGQIFYGYKFSRSRTSKFESTSTL